MNKAFSLRHLVFFGLALLFTLPFVSGGPVMAQAGTTAATSAAITEASAEKDTAKEEDVAPAAKLNVRSKALVKGKTYTLKVYNLTEEQTVSFKTDAPAIVSVDEEGLVTGLDYGTAVITATVREGTKVISSLSCDITVGTPAISVKLTKNELVLLTGKRTTLKTILQPYNTVEETKFLSSDTTVATVSTGGRITAKSVGTAEIYAVLDNGKYDTCIVTVVDEETYQKLMAEQEPSSDSEDTEKTPSEEEPEDSLKNEEPEVKTPIDKLPNAELQ